MSTPPSNRPTGQLEALDEAMRQVMARQRIPGAALAIAHNGRLVLARGYGLADIERNEPVQPQSLFALQSISKTITAVGILKLIEQGRLQLDDRAFRLLDLAPPPGAAVDPRIYEITIRQLLNHSAGWNSQPPEDVPHLERTIAERLGVEPPILPSHLIRFWLSTPLDHPPGTEQHYLRLGFIVLGLVIEKVTGQVYADYIMAHVLGPMGIRHMRLAAPPPSYSPGEVSRYVLGSRQRHGSGCPPMRLPTGGWVGSCIDLVRLLTALDGSRGPAFLSDATVQRMTELLPPFAPRPDGTWYGLGWDYVQTTPQGPIYAKMGRGYGVESWMQHLTDGIDWAMGFNTNLVDLTRTFQPDLEQVEQAIQASIAAVREWPEIDLFPQYP